MHQSKEKKKKKRAPIKLHPRLLASCEFQPGKADNISNTNDPESSTDGRTEGKKRKTSSSTTTENEKRQSFFSLSLELERYIIIYTPYPPYIVEPPAPFSASLLPIGHKSKLRRHGRSGLTTTTVPSTTRVLDDLLVGVVVVFRLLLLSIAAVVPWVPDWRRPPVSIWRQSCLVIDYSRRLSRMSLRRRRWPSRSSSFPAVVDARRLLLAYPVSYNLHHDITQIAKI